MSGPFSAAKMLALSNLVKTVCIYELYTILFNMWYNFTI